MSDKDKQQQPKRSNPLAGSALFPPGTPPAQNLPPLPTPAPIAPQASPQTQDEPPLLYLSDPSAEYMNRPFDRKRDKGAINGHPYLLGAVDAINKMRDIDKYKAYDEMCRDYIAKYRHLLEQRPDMVRESEAKYRQKHHL